MTKNQEQQGLYEPQTESDACGVGFVVDMKGRKSHKIIDNALTILKNLSSVELLSESTELIIEGV